MVDPLELAEPAQYRFDVVRVRDLLHGGQRVLGDEHVVQHVVEGADGLHTGREVRWGDHGPGRVRALGDAPDGDLRRDRAVGHVVVPGVVVGDTGDRLLRSGVGGRRADAADDQQPAVGLGGDRSQGDRPVHDLPGEGGVLVQGGADLLAAGVDDEFLPVGSPDVEVPAAQLGLLETAGLIDVEREMELVPGGFLVGQVHRPLDLGDPRLAQFEFPDGFPGLVVAVDPEPGGLPDDLPRAVLVRAGRQRRLVRGLRADEGRFVAVADPGYADGGMDFDLDYLRVHRGAFRWAGVVPPDGSNVDQPGARRDLQASQWMNGFTLSCRRPRPLPPYGAGAAPPTTLLRRRRDPAARAGRPGRGRPPAGPGAACAR